MRREQLYDAHFSPTWPSRRWRPEHECRGFALLEMLGVVLIIVLITGTYLSELTVARDVSACIGRSGDDVARRSDFAHALGALPMSSATVGTNQSQPGAVSNTARIESPIRQRETAEPDRDLQDSTLRAARGLKNTAARSNVESYAVAPRSSGWHP